jgi:hypothetical protein
MYATCHFQLAACTSLTTALIRSDPHQDGGTSEDVILHSVAWVLERLYEVL